MTDELRKEPEQSGEEKQGNIPPKLDLRDAGALNDAGASLKQPVSSQTVRMKIKEPASGTDASAPAASAAKPAQPVVSGVRPIGLESKKETSRIPLTAAKPAPETTQQAGAAKPVVIKSSGSATLSAGGVKPAMPATPAVKQARNDAHISAMAAKRKTSRISLEAALAPESTSPTTIRIKPPTGTQAIESRAQVAPASGKTTPLENQVKIASRKTTPLAQVQAKAAVSKTARLEPGEQQAGGEAPTRRKTIRVKRPATSHPTMRTAADSAVESDQEYDFAEPMAEEKMGWFFPAVAVVAVIVAALVVYVLAIQALDLGLVWPGSIH